MELSLVFYIIASDLWFSSRKLIFSIDFTDRPSSAYVLTQSQIWNFSQLTDPILNHVINSKKWFQQQSSGAAFYMLIEPISLDQLRVEKQKRIYLIFFFSNSRHYGVVSLKLLLNGAFLSRNFDLSYIARVENILYLFCPLMNS